MSKKTLLAAAVVIVTGFAGFQAFNLTNASATSVTAEKAAETHTSKEVSAEDLQSGKFLIVDARSVDDFAKAHIKDAVSLPADAVTADALAKIAKDKNQQIAFYCGSTECSASVKAAGEAMKAGYPNVSHFKGGLKEWQEKGLAVESAS